MTALYCIHGEPGDSFYVKEGKFYSEFREDPESDNSYLIVHGDKRSSHPEGSFLKFRFIEIPLTSYTRLICEQ